jgi:hypothetical protein
MTANQTSESNESTSVLRTLALGLVIVVQRLLVLGSLVCRGSLVLVSMALLRGRAVALLLSVATTRDLAPKSRSDIGGPVALSSNKSEIAITTKGTFIHTCERWGWMIL